MKDHTGNGTLGKFQDPETTASGEIRARVELTNPDTLWFNTGTLCNIECVNCYIESSPQNDRLVYLTEADVTQYLDQLDARNWRVREIGFTGGEPFMNPDIIAMVRAALDRGYEVLILTNAMRPMMRPKMREGLLGLAHKYRNKLTLRISVDHHTAKYHDTERGKGTFDITLEGMRWLRDQHIKMAVAGRTMWGETEADSRDGFAKLYAENKFDIDAYNLGQTVLFPEMDASADVPEITSSCWSILGKSPDSVMCSSSRMVVRRKGAPSPSVVACTLLPYQPEFDMGQTLEQAEAAVHLNHPHCAKFCVLGGASCSA